VITPNLYNVQLWETSGHWQHYAEHMFQFDCEGQVCVSCICVYYRDRLSALLSPQKDVRVEADELPWPLLDVRPRVAILSRLAHALRGLWRAAPQRALGRPYWPHASTLPWSRSSCAVDTLAAQVRRFQQDDAHIFCRRDQIKDEVRVSRSWNRWSAHTYAVRSAELSSS
jgi:threonyl-tRNA synthetase